MKMIIILGFLLGSSCFASEYDYKCGGDTQTYEGATVSQTDVQVHLDWNAKVLTQTVVTIRQPPFENAGTTTQTETFRLDSSTPTMQNSGVASCQQSIVHAFSVEHGVGATLFFLSCSSGSLFIEASSDNLVCDPNIDQGRAVTQGFQETLCDIDQ